MSNEFDDYDDEYERPELDPPDPDADDPRVERKRRRRAPSQNARGNSQATAVQSPATSSAQTKVAAKPKPSEEDWGFEDEEEDGIAEWKLGLVLVLVLMGGFGFVAWRKYDTIKAIAQSKIEEFSSSNVESPEKEQDLIPNESPLGDVVLAPPESPRTDGITTADSSIDANPFGGQGVKDRASASFTSLGVSKQQSPTKQAVPPPSDAAGWDAPRKSSPTLAATKPKDQITFDFASPSRSNNDVAPKNEKSNGDDVDVFDFAAAKTDRGKPKDMTSGFAAKSPAGSGPNPTPKSPTDFAPIDLGPDPFAIADKKPSASSKPNDKTTPARPAATVQPLAEVASNDPFAVPLLDDPLGADLPDLSTQPSTLKEKQPTGLLPDDPFALPASPVTTKSTGPPPSNQSEPTPFDLPDTKPQANDFVEKWAPKPQAMVETTPSQDPLGLDPLPDDPFTLEPIAEQPVKAIPDSFGTPLAETRKPQSPKTTGPAAGSSADPFGLEPIVPKAEPKPDMSLPDDPFGLPPVATTPSPAMTKPNKPAVTMPMPTGQRSIPKSTQPSNRLPSNSFVETPARPFTQPTTRSAPQPSTGPQRVDTAIATRRYKVGDGENYWAISKSQYGTVRYFAALAVWNKKVVEDPRHLRPGMTIELPPADLLEPLVKTASLPVVSPRSTNPMATLRPEAHTARQHKVATGESYWSISKSQYGSSRYFAALAEWNKVRVPDPRRLTAGTIIDLPAAKDLEPLVASASPNGPAPAKSTDTGADGFFKTAQGEPRYRVGPNETLSAIAQKTLGRASRWRQIYAMNGDVVSSPERIAQGVILRLPPDSLQVADGR